MYSGSSPTALRSIEAMKDALLSLMKSDSYDKISITEICREAGLSRQTFYNCFDGKDDILRFYVRKCFTDITGGLTDEVADHHADILEQNRELLSLIVENRLVYLLFAEISALVEARVSINASSHEPKNDAYYAAYLSGALTSVLTYWLRDPNRVSVRQLVALMQDILSGGYPGMLRGLPEARNTDKRSHQAGRDAGDPVGD